MAGGGGGGGTGGGGVEVIDALKEEVDKADGRGGGGGGGVGLTNTGVLPAAGDWGRFSIKPVVELIQVGMGFASPAPCIGGGGGGSWGLTKTLSSALVRSSLIWLNGKAERE